MGPLVGVAVFLLQVAAPVLGTGTTDYDLTCPTGHQKIVGSWRYSNKTCGEVNAEQVDYYDAGYLAECQRWLNTKATTISNSNMYDCIKATNGQVRYREEVCCNAATTLHRCFKCPKLVVPYDRIQSGYIPEACDYNHTVETCAPGQVCITHYSYNITSVFVSKGCADSTPCSAKEANNSWTCRSMYDSWPQCTYCCKDRFCNHLDTVTKPRRLYRLSRACCYNGGTCLDPTNNTCICPPGYYGYMCRYSPCSGRPCKNSGICRVNQTSAHGYTCHCRPQYTGRNCSLDADKCDVNKPSRLCQNGGTCYTHAYGDRCVCQDGFVGSLCENQTGVLKCPANRQHYVPNGVSLTSYTTYNCSKYVEYNTRVPGTRYLITCFYLMTAGRYPYTDKSSLRGIAAIPWETLNMCEKGQAYLWGSYEVCCPACFSFPCQNGGWCETDGLGYVCKCRFGFDGKNCQHKISMCLISGDPHVTTFDGQMMSPQATCKGILVDSPRIPFQILGKNEHRHGNIRVSYVRYLEIVVGDYVARLDRNKAVYVNDVQYYPHAVVGPITIENNGMFVRVVAIIKDDISQEELEVVLESDGEWTSLIKLPPTLKNNVTGLCGNFNGDPDDDLTTCDGKDVRTEPNKYSLISKSCQVEDPTESQCTSPSDDPPTCSKQQIHTITQKCEHILSGLFSACENLMDLKAQYGSCNFDVCATGQASAGCKALHSVAIQCASKGTNIDWREKTGCPASCPEPLVYKALASACHASCRRPDAPSLCRMPDKESCVCPDDRPMLHDGQCVPAAECPCTAPDGTSVKLGSQWMNPNCTVRYTCVLCETCTIPALQNEAHQCLGGQVCGQRNGVYSCVDDTPNCDECALVNNEVGYLAYPGSDTDYYQCSKNAQGEWEVKRRQCPACTFWDQVAIACNWDPALLLDGCQDDYIHIDEEVTLNTIDGSCQRSDFVARPHTSDICWHEQEVQGAWVSRPCPPGTAFNLVRCSCIVSLKCAGQSNQPSCLSFDKGFNKLTVYGPYLYITWSLNGQPQWAQKFPTRSGPWNNAGIFASNNLEIPLYLNTAWRHFRISFYFMQEERDGTMQGLVSNGDCRKQPSLLVSLQNSGALVVQLRPSGQNEEVPGELWEVISKDRFSTNIWYHVSVTYFQQTVTLFVDYDLQGQKYIEVEADKAYIKHRCSVLVGAAPSGNLDPPRYFQGLIDMLCIQKDIEEPRPTTSTPTDWTTFIPFPSA